MTHTGPAAIWVHRPKPGTALPWNLESHLGFRHGSANVTTDLRQRLLDSTPLTERHLDLDGVRTATVEAGDGPPILLLHGQGENWAVWLPVLDDLLTTYRVVAVDLPGHGASTPIDGRLDRDTVLAWLDRLITATGDEPPVVVGHLLGGAIAARYAVDHSDRLAHLVLVDTLGLGWFRPSPRFAIPMMRFMARPTERSRDRLFAQCFEDWDRTSGNFGEQWDDLLAYALDRAQQPQTQAALRALMPRFGMPPIPHRYLDRITAPTTLVHGRGDLQVDVALAEAASRRHGWPLHVIDDARDDPAAEQPERFVAALREAIARAPAPNRTAS